MAIVKIGRMVIKYVSRHIFVKVVDINGEKKGRRINMKWYNSWWARIGAAALVVAVALSAFGVWADRDAYVNKRVMARSEWQSFSPIQQFALRFAMLEKKLGFLSQADASTTPDYVTTSSTDNTTANTAISAVASKGGGMVILGHGYFGNVWINSSNITLQGQGQGATIIKVANSVNQNGITIGDGVNAYSNIFIQDLTVNGNNNNNTSGHGILFAGKITFSTIERVYETSAAQDGIHSTGGSIPLGNHWNTLRNVNINSNTGWGTYLATSDNDWVIDGSSYSTSVGGGIHIDSAFSKVTDTYFLSNNGTQLDTGSYTVGMNFAQLSIEYGQGVSFVLAGQGNTVNGLTIRYYATNGLKITGQNERVSNVYVETGTASTSDAIYILNNSSNSLSGATIVGAVGGGGRHGVNVNNSPNTAVLNVTVNNTANGLTGAGITVDSGSTGTTVTGCTVYKSGSQGIYSAAPQGTITGSVAYHSGWEGMYLAGNYMTGTGNIIEGSSQSGDSNNYEVYISGNNVVFTGNVILSDLTTNISAYWIRYDGTNEIITNNQFTGTSHNTVRQGGGATAKISGNQGYVTEASGASVGTGAQQTIAHGLSFTPTKTQIAVFSDNSSGVVYLSANPDSTNIYVTAPNNSAWHWSTLPR